MSIIGILLPCSGGECFRTGKLNTRDPPFTACHLQPIKSHSVLARAGDAWRPRSDCEGEHIGEDTPSLLLAKVHFRVRLPPRRQSHTLLTRSLRVVVPSL